MGDLNIMFWLFAWSTLLGLIIIGGRITGATHKILDFIMAPGYSNLSSANRKEWNLTKSKIPEQPSEEFENKPLTGWYGNPHQGFYYISDSIEKNSLVEVKKETEEEIIERVHKGKLNPATHVIRHLNKYGKSTRQELKQNLNIDEQEFSYILMGLLESKQIKLEGDFFCLGEFK